MTPNEVHFTRDVTVVAARTEAHEEIMVRRLDLTHVREELERVKAPRVWIVAMASILAGTAVAAAVAAATEALARDSDAGVSYAWVVPVFLASAGFCAVFAVVLFILDDKLRDEHDGSVEHVLARLKELEAMFPTRVRTSAVDLTIIRASYGLDGHWLDVTGHCRDRMQGGSLDLDVSNDEFGHDPIPGQVKELNIQYRLGGSEYEKPFKEGTRVALP